MVNKDMILYNEINDLSISELSEEQIKIVAVRLLEDINIKRLENDINETILKLSCVGDPSFGADLKFIALDNQTRLKLINMLLNNFNLFKSCRYNLRRNVQDCRENFDQIYSIVNYAKQLIETVIEYGEFSKVNNESEKLIDNKSEQILLNKGENVNE